MKKILSALLALLLLVGMFAACTERAAEEREAEASGVLIFNTPEPENSMNISPVWYGAFSHDLTEEELRTVFPYLDLPLEATVYYKEDGTIVELWAWAPLFSNQLQIRFWLDGFSYDLFQYGFASDFSPQVSNIHGVPVTAYMIDGWGPYPSFRAEFMLGDFVFRVLFSYTEEAGQAQMTEIVNQLIIGGLDGLAILEDPEIPELRSEALSLEEARLDPDFGLYVPVNVPEEFYGAWPHRSINQHENILRIEWQIPPDADALYVLYTDWIREQSPSADPFTFEEVFWGSLTLRWNVSAVTEWDLERIVSAEDRYRYDWSLYPLVQMPDDLRKFHEIPYPYGGEAFHSPVFLAEEFTLDVLQAREMMRIWPIQVIDGSYSEDMRDIFLPLERYEFEFGVLFDDILVQISAVGVSAAQIWSMLEDVMQR